MEPTSEERNGPLLPLLYALLAIDGILTALLIAGIVLFALRPAESAVVQPNAPAAVAEQQRSYGPRTMISTYSIRVEERGWNPETGKVVRPGGDPEPTGNQVPESNPAANPEEPEVQNPVEDAVPIIAPETQTPPQETQDQNPEAVKQPASNKATAGNWGEESTTNEITGSLSKTAYWVTSGKSYHFSENCPSLSRSRNIQTGTLQDALNAGKTDPCNNCANGS